MDVILLKNIEIPYSVTTIKIGAFYNCTALGSLTISEYVSEIEPGAFANTFLNLSVNYKNTHYRVENEVLFDRNKTVLIKYMSPNTDLLIYNGTYTIPGGITKIEKYAFAGAAIGNITILNSVTRIEDYAFTGWLSTNTLTIPSSI